MALAGIGIGMFTNLTVLNATPYPWHRTLEQSYQMTSWSFPSVIPPGNLVTVATEWSWLGDRKDDAGEVGYSFSTDDGENMGFQVHADYNGSPKLSVLLDKNTKTLGNPAGSVIDLDFNGDGTTPFIFSGDAKTGLASTNPPLNWLYQSLSTIGCLPLSRLSLPASHNAGMSVLTSGTAFATPDNTLAHYTDIQGQLRQGIRWFDIRPVISKGQMLTGHYSDTAQRIGDDGLEIGVGWQGGNGQSIASIITQINEFLDGEGHGELVIINISHTLDTDNGYKSFNQAQQDVLFRQLLNLKYRFVAPTPASTSEAPSNLAQLKLNDLIRDKSAVLIVLDTAQTNENLSAASFPNQGFYTNDQFPVYNQYANTDSLAGMAKDQLSKMTTQSTRGEDMFLLSWTLTTPLNIRLYAEMANDALYRMVWPVLKKEVYPSFVMIDGVGGAGAGTSTDAGSLAAFCLAIMRNFNDACGE